MIEGMQSLGFRLLVRMVIRVSLVLLLVTVLGYFYVYQCVKTFAVDDFRAYVAERGERESQLFVEAQNDLQQLRRAFVDELAKPVPADTGMQFDQRYQRQPDGSWRRRQGADSGQEASVFLAPQRVLTDDIRRRLLLEDKLASEYGRAWRGEVASTYIASFDGMYASFWPGIDGVPAGPTTADVSYLRRLEKTPAEANGLRGPSWTPIWYDPRSGGWYSSCLLPLAAGGRLQHYFGAAVSLDSILRRLSEARLPGAYNVLFRADGRLISHPAHMQDIAASHGDYDIRHSPDTGLRTLYQTALDAGTQSVLAVPQLDAYIGITRVSGPDWYLVSVYPRSAIASVARETATVMLWLGVLAVLLSLPILYATVNSQVARPLRRLLSMAESLESGNRNVKVDIQGNDEIGVLAATFNRLAVMVSERDFALRSYAEGLEKLVDERTAELKQAKEAAEYLSLHDELTQLANRRLLLQLLDQAMHLAQRNLQPLALVFIDVNEFRGVNDQFGHAAGDKVLATVAKRIQATVRKQDTAARFAGDEFVVLLPELNDVSDTAQVMEKLHRAIGEPIHVHGNTLQVSVSMGVAVYPVDGNSPAALLQHADELMYRDKSRIVEDDG